MGESSLYRSIEWTIPRIVLVTTAVLTALMHVRLGVVTGAWPFVPLGAGLVVLTVVYFTRYWATVLYFVAAVYTGIIAVVWVLWGTPVVPVAVAGMILHTLLFVLLVVFLVRELRGDTDEPARDKGVPPSDPGDDRSHDLAEEP